MIAHVADAARKRERLAAQNPTRDVRVCVLLLRVYALTTCVAATGDTESALDTLRGRVFGQRRRARACSMRGGVHVSARAHACCCVSNVIRRRFYKDAYTVIEATGVHAHRRTQAIHATPG